MKSSQILDTIKALYPYNRPIMLTGAPGGGKTSVVRQAAEALNVDYREIHIPTSLVEDFGIPYPNKTADTFGYKMPEWFPTDPESQGILCFDDRSQGSNDIQKVLANIIHARTLHNTPLSDGWMVVSTGNRITDRAGANRTLAHLANRETALAFETDLNDWSAWATANDVRMEVIAFLRFRPNLLHDFDPQRDQNPTPRSWVEGVSALMGLVPHDLEFEVFSGAVGEGPAAEFMGFLKVLRKIPNPDSILLNPSTAPVPTDPATLYALTGALWHRATASNFDRIMEYTARLPPEFEVLLVQQAQRRCPDIERTKSYTNFHIRRQNVLL